MAIVSSLTEFAPSWTVAHPKLAVISLLFSALFIWWLISTVQQYWRLRHFKGPPTTGFSIFWLLKTTWSWRADLAFWEVSKKYGSIARIGPNDLVTSEIDLVKRTGSTKSQYTRSNFYEGFRFDHSRDNVISYRDDGKHTRLRAMMAPGYSGKAIPNLEAKIDKNILAFMGLLSTYASEGKRLDFATKSSYFTLDVISDIAFGDPFGSIETDSDMYDYNKLAVENMPIVMITATIPWVLKLFKLPLFSRMLPSPTDEYGFGRIMGLANKVAATRYGPNKEVRTDMLGSFVAHGLTQEEAQSEILLQIAAGGDTTSSAIRSTVLYIISNPRVLAKLRAEIAETTNITRPVIRDAEARGMPYLQAIIKEGLRIAPPVTGLAMKEVPKEGDTFNGVFIPGGTRIGYTHYGVLRKESVWGEDSSEFRPERWLDASAEELADMESSLDVVFSYGKYQCLGRPVAMVELNKIFVELFTRFDFVICDPANPWKIRNFGNYTHWDFWLRAYPRE